MLNYARIGWRCSGGHAGGGTDGRFVRPIPLADFRARKPKQLSPLEHAAPFARPQEPHTRPP